MTCKCGHTRAQHGRLGVLCMASDFSALAGTSPSGACMCLRYTPAEPRRARLRRRITQLARKTAR